MSRRGLLGLLGLTLLGCTSSGAATRDLQLFGNGGRDLATAGRGALRVVWSKELTPSRRGNYRPVESAVAAVDPEHARLYVGGASGRLHALSFEGRSLYRFELDESIESEAALDVQADELYVGTERGELYAFQPSTGKLRWRVQTGAALRQKPVLYRDAIYVVTEDDVVEGRARADGSVLWSYRRDRTDGFLIAGHAGLHLTDDARLLTAFSDGTIVALDALDGLPKWERVTATEVPEVEPGRPRYLDSDATPVVVGDMVFAASFGAGLYCLDRSNGSVLWRAAEWTGITGLAATHDGELIVVSADRGVARLNPKSRTAAWVKPPERGSFGAPVLHDGLVLVGDSRGSLLALDVDSGEEWGRIDSGHGFVARAASTPGHAFVVSNGGRLLAMRVLGSAR